MVFVYLIMDIVSFVPKKSHYAYLFCRMILQMGQMVMGDDGDGLSLHMVTMPIGYCRCPWVAWERCLFTG